MQASGSSNHVSNASYSNLWRAADLVIIGDATYSQNMRERKELSDHHMTVDCEVRDTTFRVCFVLKGTTNREELILRHYAVPDGMKPFCLFGPHLAEFRIPKEAGGFGSGVAPVAPPIPQYMLFLKKTEGRHYLPVSGQRYSADSVRDIYGYFNKPRGKRTQHQNPDPSPAAVAPDEA